MWKVLSKVPHELSVYIVNDNIVGEVSDAEVGDEFYDYDMGEDYYSVINGSQACIYNNDGEQISLGFYYTGYEAKQAVEAIVKLMGE